MLNNIKLKNPIGTISMVIITEYNKSIINRLIENDLIPILFVKKGTLYNDINKNFKKENIKGLLFCIDNKKIIKYEC